MRTSILLGLFGAVALVSFAASGCGGGSSSSSTTGTGGGSPGNDTCAADVDVTGCDTILAAGADDTTRVQTALIEVKSDSTVCFCPGTYKINQQLSLTVPKVTVRGAGKNIGDTVLDFAGAADGASGNDTMLVTADDFTIENLTVKNTPGNGVVVRQAERPTFRKLSVFWDGGAKASNGAYAIYPVECKDVLVEDCDVHGASDAAIYVGQVTGALVRNNKAYESVLGIELENTTDGEVYGNEILRQLRRPRGLPPREPQQEGQQPGAAPRQRRPRQQPRELRRPQDLRRGDPSGHRGNRGRRGRRRDS